MNALTHHPMAATPTEVDTAAIVVATELRSADGVTTPCTGAPLLAGELRRRGVATVSEAVRLGEGSLAAYSLGDHGSALGIAFPSGAEDAAALAQEVLSELAAVRGPHTVLLASPRGFCAGVDRAIEIVRRILTHRPGRVYVRKQIVHNLHVVRELEGEGAVFVDEVDDVPPGSTVVFSAHGVSPAVRDEARRRQLEVIDATCPLVSKVHAEARRFAGAGDTVVLIGHADHEEVEGTMGEAPDRTVLVESVADVERLEVEDPARISYLTRTTLALDETTEMIEALRARFPELREPPSSDICYATTNRQEALAAIADESDLVLVVGSDNSSNSVRLAEVTQRNGKIAHLVDNVSEIRPQWLRGVTTIGISAGASTPSTLVEGVVHALGGLGPLTVDERLTSEESVEFGLPLAVRRAAR